MYIHAYQIHNVLNAYRKQLSQNSGKGPVQQPASNAGDRIHISAKAQNHKILDDISSQIIERMTAFDKALTDQLSRFKGETPIHAPGHDTHGMTFTYKKIDERNHKTISRLDIRPLNPFNHSFGPTSAGVKVGAQQPASAVTDHAEKETLNE